MEEETRRTEKEGRISRKHLKEHERSNQENREGGKNKHLGEHG